MRPFTVLRRILPETGALACVELPPTAAGAGNFPAAAFAFEARVSGSSGPGRGGCRHSVWYLRRSAALETLGVSPMRGSLWSVPVSLCTALLVLGLLAACGPGVRRLPPPSTDIDEDLLRSAIRALSSDDFAGRQPGTAGEDKTIAYLTAQFKKLGMKPGNGESFLQQVPVVELLAGPDCTLAVAGRNGTRALAYRQDMVIWSKRAVPQAQIAHSELVFVGYGIVAPEYAWDDYAGVDVRGKTVVVMLKDPGSADADAKLFKGRATTSYGRSSYKIEEAARHGASGVLLIHDPDASYAWDVVVNDATAAQLVRAAPDGDAGRATIEGWLSGAAARAIFAQAGLDFRLSRRRPAGPGFGPCRWHCPSMPRFTMRFAASIRRT